MLTKQEMFARAWNGLRAQGWKPSIDQFGNCQYNGDDGYRCAWGHVDPEGTSDPETEGVNWWSLWERKIGLAAGITVELQPFVEQLQAAHDDTVMTTPSFNRPDMEANLRDLAAEHGLEVPE